MLSLYKGRKKNKLYKPGRTYRLFHLRYAAKHFDPEVNLIFFGKRYYDPELARWLTTEPADFLDSINLYQYTLNNPFRYCDPKGEFVFLLAIPFAQMLCSAIIIEAVVDAVIVGAAAWEPGKGQNMSMM